MKTLKIKLINIDNPYSYEKSSYYDLWGTIQLHYENETLLDTQWNIFEFIEWFNKCDNKLSNEIFPFRYYNSIAESRNILFSKDDFTNNTEEDKYYYKLGEYFQCHCFKLKGTNTPIFYIGFGCDFIGEISYEREKQFFKYTFDMKRFITDTDLQIKEFVAKLFLDEKRLSYFKETIPKYFSHLK